MNRTKPVAGHFIGMDFPTYQAIDAANNTALREIDRSGGHYKHARDAEDTKKGDALRLGSCLHAMVLQPEKYKSLIALGPVNPSTNKQYGRDTKKWEDAEALCPPGITLVTEDMAARANKMAASMRTHRSLRDALGMDDKGVKLLTEVVLVWEEKIEIAKGEKPVSVWCKARLDAIAAPHYLFDLKSSDDASELAFAKSCASYGYAEQCAHYERGAEVVFGKPMPLVFGVVESDEPHGVAVYTLGESSRSAGRQIRSERLQKLAKCLASSDWGMYKDSIQTLELPAWFLKKFQDGE